MRRFHLPSFFPSVLLFLYFSAWIVYFAVFWSHAVFFDAAGNLIAGHVNIWGDWAAHFTMTTALATRGIGITSPFLIGAQFSYPFAADLVSAILLQLHVPFISAFVIPSFLFCITIVFALYFFYKTIFHLRTIAILASLIFLLNGGLGFWYFAQDVIHSPQPTHTIVNPPHEYTRLDSQNIKWISVIDSMMIPERAFAIGFPVALIGLTLAWSAAQEKDKEKNRRSIIIKLVIAGVLLGVLPFFHTHSFLAAFIVLASWAGVPIFFYLKKNGFQRAFPVLKPWLILAVVTGVIALPLMKILFFGHISSSFFRFYPGWLAMEFKTSWLLFWWKNWGLTPLAAILGTYFLLRNQKKNFPTALAFCIPFFIIFILANLFLFQPWSWDNTKLFMWTSVGFSGLAAYFLFYLFHSKKYVWPTRIAGIIVFFLIIASGTIDAYWDVRTDLHSYQMFSQTEWQFAQWTKKNTDPHSIWLTSDQHNHWLYDLTGRQSVMTFRGWLWTHGYQYAQVEQDVTNMFAGNAQTIALLQKYNVNYVIIGPSERDKMDANEAFYIEHFPIVKEDETTRIYKIK